VYICTDIHTYNDGHPCTNAEAAENSARENIAAENSARASSTSPSKNSQNHEQVAIPQLSGKPEQSPYAQTPSTNSGGESMGAEALAWKTLYKVLTVSPGGALEEEEASVMMEILVRDHCQTDLIQRQKRPTNFGLHGTGVQVFVVALILAALASHSRSPPAGDCLCLENSP
jgi:hypothetical protein